jgi:3-dehydrosphinganine reductase
MSVPAWLWEYQYALSAAVLAISLPIVYKMLFSTKNKFPIEGLTAIVTGGSQGFGLALAEELAAKGANVVLVARDATKLETAIKSLQSRAKNPSSQRFLHLSYDLRLAESARQILHEVKAWNDDEAPDLVFCCAGHCYPSFFADAPVEQLRDQMDTIYWSSAWMAHAAINMWKTPSSSKRKDVTAKPARHVVFTCSTLAFFSVAGYSPYSPCKAAMRSLADSLNQELEVYNGSRQNPSLGPVPDADMKVHILFPMGIDSPGFVNENKIKPQLTLELEKDDKPQQPDELARIALAKLGAGEYMISTMFLGHLMRGVGMGGSVRMGIMDVFWNYLGSFVVIFVVSDFISKCRNWGKQKGMNSTGTAV